MAVNYTLVMRRWDLFRSGSRWIYADEGFRSDLLRAGLNDLADVSSPDLGTPVTHHRSSWVRIWKTGSSTYYVKTYDYPTWRDRGRGIGRNTLLAPSRPRREQLALNWLQEHGFGGPRVRGVGESRSLGLLRRAVLVTEAWPGAPLADLLPRLDPTRRDQLLGCLTDFVLRLHRAGFRDRNLDLRNLLARTQEGGWKIVKLDSPRFRIARSSDEKDRLARDDWRRLERSVEEIGLSLARRTGMPASPTTGSTT